MKKSIIKKNTRANLILDYNLSFPKKNEFEKVKWSSKISMFNRYKLLFKFVAKEKIHRWLDVGSGTGSIFRHHDKLKKNNIKFRLGIEINKKLYNYSKKKKYKKKVYFENNDILSFNKKSKFNLITLIGVLQNCGHYPAQILKKCVDVLADNGLLFLITKNLLWNKFSMKFKPSKEHSWFNPYEIKKILEKLNIDIILMLGFDPKLNRLISLEKAHTFFIFGKKNFK